MFYSEQDRGGTRDKKLTQRALPDDVNPLPHRVPVCGTDTNCLVYHIPLSVSFSIDLLSFFAVVNHLSHVYFVFYFLLLLLVLCFDFSRIPLTSFTHTRI